MKGSFYGRINDKDMVNLIAGPEENNICDECLLEIADEILTRDASLRE